MRFPLDNVDNDDMERTPPQTEDAAERGFTNKRRNEDLGRSEHQADDENWDIADEGPGHRG